MSPTRRNRNAPSLLAPTLAQTVRAGGPFESSPALEAGLVTRYALANHFIQYLPGIYIAPGTEISQWDRIRAVSAWARAGSVIGGWAAAHLLGEHYISRNHRHSPVVYSIDTPHAPRGVRWRRIRRPLDKRDFASTTGITHTSAPRTAVDVARWMVIDKPGTNADSMICAIDSICNASGTGIDAVSATAARMKGLHGVTRVVEILPDCDDRAGSPKESQLRRSIARSHLPTPVSQLKILDRSGRKIATPDLACAQEKVAIFYDGEVHGHPDQWRWDLGVTAELTNLGWEVVRITKDMTPAAAIRHIDLALQRARLKHSA